MDHASLSFVFFFLSFLFLALIHKRRRQGVHGPYPPEPLPERRRRLLLGAASSSAPPSPPPQPLPQRRLLLSAAGPVRRSSGLHRDGLNEDAAARACPREDDAPRACLPCQWRRRTGAPPHSAAGPVRRSSSGSSSAATAARAELLDGLLRTLRSPPARYLRPAGHAATRRLLPARPCCC
jgi:hypothetical protein